MDIYVYAGDAPIMGEHTRPQILLPLEDGNFVFNDDEEIGIKVSDGKKRLNLYVYDGWDGKGFSQKVMKTYNFSIILVMMVKERFISYVMENFQ